MFATNGDALRSLSSWGEGEVAGFRRRAHGIPPYPAIPVRNRQLLTCPTMSRCMETFD